MGVFYGCDYGFGFDRNLLKVFPADSLISYQEPTSGYLMLMTESEKLWCIIPKKITFFPKSQTF